MKRTAIISAVLAIMACFPSYAENVSFGTEDAAQSDTLKVKKKNPGNLSYTMSTAT